jgi:hypothetical protein
MQCSVHSAKSLGAQGFSGLRYWRPSNSRFPYVPPSWDQCQKCVGSISRPRASFAIRAGGPRPEKGEANREYGSERRMAQVDARVWADLPEAPKGGESRGRRDDGARPGGQQCGVFGNESVPAFDFCHARPGSLVRDRAGARVARPWRSGFFRRVSKLPLHTDCPALVS